jgi:hypothetical protein
VFIRVIRFKIIGRVYPRLSAIRGELVFALRWWSMMLVAVGRVDAEHAAGREVLRLDA